MTELDTNVELDETLDNEPSDTEDTPDEISYEQAMEWKKKAERLEKAEKTLVEYKKQLKSTKPESDSEVVTKRDLELEKELVKNPELEDYKDSIVKYYKGDITLKQAIALAKLEDEPAQNREKLKSTRIADGNSESKKSVYTREELASLPQHEYNKVMEQKAQGKIRIK